MEKTKQTWNKKGNYFTFTFYLHLCDDYNMNLPCDISFH
jgi:hypothetical protein